MEIKKTKARVKALLENTKTLRDNDNKLIVNIWIDDLSRNGVDVKKLSAMEFLYIFADYSLTSPESVRRSRAALQEQEPDLRGDNYKKRKKHSKKIQSELGYFVK